MSLDACAAPCVDRAELPAWLAAQRERMRAEPAGNAQVLANALASFERLYDGPVDEALIELALLCFELTCELRQLMQVLAVAERTRDWADQSDSPRQQSLLCSLQARAHLVDQRFDLAEPQIERAHALAQRCGDTEALAHAVCAQGLLAHRREELPQCAALLREVIRILQPRQDHMLLPLVHASLAVVLRDMGEHAERRLALDEGVRLAVAQRRWGEAANLASGLVDIALEEGDISTAEARLLSCASLLAQGGGHSVDQALGESSLQFSRARCLALRGRYAEACELMRQTLPTARPRLPPVEVSRRLDQLADWLAADGQAQAALDTAREAQELLLQQAQHAGRRSLVLMRQSLELSQAEAQRGQSERQAAELQAQSETLEQALQAQRSLQTELIESSKLAALGNLLAGVAHELHTPLGTALTAVSTLGELSQSMQATVSSGKEVRRSALLASLQTCRVSGELAQHQLQRALDLVASYRSEELHREQAPATEQRLDTLVQSAWERALTPGSPLRLALHGTALSCRLRADALGEVLMQLFQNAERHAYLPGHAGLVQVEAAVAAGQLRLAVSDLGRGMPAELLARAFEPYVSTQFSRGRSGLGLFIARATLAQRLGGQIQVHSQAGQGTRFEIVCPVDTGLMPATGQAAWSPHA